MILLSKNSSNTEVVSILFFLVVVDNTYKFTIYFVDNIHASEIKSLCSLSSDILQKLSYFWDTKT